MEQFSPPAPLSIAATSPAAAEKTRRVPRALDGRSKAAIVVRLLLNEGADIPLEELPDDLQAELTQQMGQMGLVDRVTLASVAEEFAEALDAIGLTFPQGLAGALHSLDGKISPQTAARLRKEAGVRQIGDPWKRLRELEISELSGLVEAEATEVSAVLLSKLDVPKAAELLEHLPGPVARKITYAVSRTAAVTPEAVDRIGLSLAAQLDDRPPRAFGDEPGSRVGAILNQSPSSTRDEMLTSLDEMDAFFASVVRASIFTFADIPERLSPRDAPTVMRQLDSAILVTALAGLPEDLEQVSEFLLGNISKRMAENLREEVTDKGKVAARDAERAMTEIVGVIQTLAQDGEIELITPEADDEG